MEQQVLVVEQEKPETRVVKQALVRQTEKKKSELQSVEKLHVLFPEQDFAAAAVVMNLRLVVQCSQTTQAFVQVAVLA